ncbi:MAG: cytochrome c biogenesis CcdA family protein [Candidatus Bathyarchaeia archaeon]
MAGELGLGVAVFAGALSFFSPCVLPLIPGYLAYISGTNLNELASKKSRVLQGRVFLNAVFFTAAFSAVFIVLGLSLAGVFGATGPGFQVWLNRVGGVLIMVFGIHILGLITIPIFERTAKISTPKLRLGPLNSAAVGASFGVGWTPCFGPLLASILVIAGTSGSATSGGFLLGAYSLGLAIPFLVTGLFTQNVSGFITRNHRRFKWMTQISGVILIALGIVVFTGSFARILALLPSEIGVLFLGV